MTIQKSDRITIRQKKRGRPSKKFLAAKAIAEEYLNSPKVKAAGERVMIRAFHQVLVFGFCDINALVEEEMLWEKL